MEKLEKVIIVVLLILLIPLLAGLYYFFKIQDNNTKLSQAFPQQKLVGADNKSIATISAVEITKIAEPIIVSKLANPPQIIRAIYVTGWSAGSLKYSKYLDNIFATTEINAVVIDIKDYSGKVFLNSSIAPSISNLIQHLHEKGIYVIARIVVFEDPVLAKARPDLAIYNREETVDVRNPVLWLDNHKLPWLDPASKEVWDYNISIAKNAVEHGFDEINFDYVRFPSDGKTSNMGFPIWGQTTSRRFVIKSFFQELRKALVGVKISADIFGYATVTKDDMGIGQVLEDSFEYFDYISPMVYPSHYSDNFLGYKNPAEYPYEVVNYSMQEALKRQTEYYKDPVIIKSKFRPWLQDFDMGAVYTQEMVLAQIQATKNALGEDFNGFMLWNPSNVYSLSFN